MSEQTIPAEVVGSSVELGLLYAERDHLAQGNFYTRHVMAMTEEGLHRKSAIAAELAHRDMDIARLRAALMELLACHTESAGWSMSMLANRAEFDAMLVRSQERIEAAIGAARQALGMCQKCGLPPGCPDCRAVHDVPEGAQHQADRAAEALRRYR